MNYRVTVNGTVHEVTVDGDRVTIGGRPVRAELSPVEGTPLRLLLLDGTSWTLSIEDGGRGVWCILAHGERHEIEVLDERAAHIRSLIGTGTAHGGPTALKAPMPGLVMRVLVEPGETVVAGQGLVVLEAMKMENELKAAGPGTVERIEVKPGQAVEKGALLMGFR